MTYPQQGGGYGPQHQGGYGPLPGYPQHGYGPPPPKKPNTGLVLGITGAVVVAVLGLVLVLVLTGDDDGGTSPGTAGGGGPAGGGIPDPTLTYTATNDAPAGGDDPAGGPGADSGPDSGGSGGAANPGELALTVAEIIQEHDVDAIEEYACNAGEAHFLQQDLAQLDGIDVIARPQAIKHTSDTMAEVSITLTFQGQTTDYPLRMQLRGDSWCAARVG